jgi:hypothetical protein
MFFDLPLHPTLVKLYTTLKQFDITRYHFSVDKMTLFIKEKSPAGSAGLFEISLANWNGSSTCLGGLFWGFSTPPPLV